MRVNIYGEEITKRVEVVETTSAEGNVFKGIRFYLKSHDDLFPPNHPDDDASAVTFWVKSSRRGHVDEDSIFLRSLFLEAASRL